MTTNFIPFLQPKLSTVILTSVRPSVRPSLRRSILVLSVRPFDRSSVRSLARQCCSFVRSRTTFVCMTAEMVLSGTIMTVKLLVQVGKTLRFTYVTVTGAKSRRTVTLSCLKTAINSNKSMLTFSFIWRKETPSHSKGHYYRQSEHNCKETKRQKRRFSSYFRSEFNFREVTFTVNRETPFLR